MSSESPASSLGLAAEPYRHPLEVIPADIDELDHVSNLVYLRWMLDAASAHSTALGWDLPAYRRLGGVFVVRRHEVDYLASVVAGDRVEAVTWVESWKAASCIRRTAIRRDGADVLRASTLWAFVDLKSGKPRRVPDELRGRFA
jgi:acyl-CoA thioester hydrolase